MPTPGQPIGDPLTGHADTVWAVALGHVGDRDAIISGSADVAVRIWDAHTGRSVGDPLTGHTRRFIVHFEQETVDLRIQLEERDEDLNAVRAANRELITQLNIKLTP